MPFRLLLGGARAGKSSLAERMARAKGGPVAVIATGQALDEEMAHRIAAHRARRDAGWKVIEEPRRLVEAVGLVDPRHTLIVDCLTLWVANRLDDDDLVDRAGDVALALARRPGLGLVVSNEVGSGIVPDNPAARRYRDLLGAVNAVLAHQAEEVYLVVAGRVIALETWDG